MTVRFFVLQLDRSFAGVNAISKRSITLFRIVSVRREIVVELRQFPRGIVVPGIFGSRLSQ
jgi:hypothetical protein